ncbi:MAG: transcription-repair coupling factor [Proteobacteria bacterium]|nr:transcription-repair coupling factor [Pseudomonadota bacterium]
MQQNILTKEFLPPEIASGKKAHVESIAAAGESLWLRDFYLQQPQQLLFITRRSSDAYHLLEELEFFAPEIPVRYLPDWETLPYDAFSPSDDIIGKRVTALVGLLDKHPGITITTITAMMLPCAPPSFIAQNAFLLEIGAHYRLGDLQQRLQQGGYQRVGRVLTAGEYAIYGGQIDIYPPGAKHPVRLVLEDDAIEQIRLFDTQSQRSIERVDSFSLLPMSECDFSPAGRSTFISGYYDQFSDDRAAICRHIKNKEVVAGIEYYLPLFYGERNSIFDYLSPQTTVVTHEGLEDPLKAFLHQARLRQKIVGTYEDRPTLPVSTLLMSAEDFFITLRQFPQAILKTAAAATAAPALPVDSRVENSHKKLLEFINTDDGQIIIAVDSPGRCDTLAVVLAEAKVKAVQCDTFSECLQHPLAITVASLRGGFVLPRAKITVLTEAEIFQVSLPPRAQRQNAATGNDLLLHEIRENDYVVHRQYGIGRSRGLKNMTVGSEVGEYLEIEYADTQRLFLPVSQLHLLERHHGVAELSKMGGRGWKKIMTRARARAHDAAVRLLEINARRAVAQIPGHCPDETMLAKFISRFIHVETADQQRAIDETLVDLRADKPMDRLIAADVGFGKTEIALRAAALAVFSGAQVAFMAPTTLLAKQHYHVFLDRFAGFPVQIAVFTSSIGINERKQMMAQLAAGKIDIIIGTHALLGKGIHYKNLGLLVIDEEHRFGVSHKEKFKNLRAGVDILSLSATPIPRTMSMALGGVRDLSIIGTPPVNRLPIQTMEAPFSHTIVLEACEREILRGGQIFFVHNEISSIEEMKEQLSKWLPQARIIVAHGAMSGGELEGAMRRFVRREGEILLCTTIVESGLDIANANTIIINRADKMGLSQLHQLRGRVGRSSAQAYAYFLRPAEGDITNKAEQRLVAARDYSALGGGFFLAMRDLEIRGAGEILGERQSGEIEAVGYKMYHSMVNAAAKQLRGGAEIETDITTTINLSAAALLPEQYVPSPPERMRYYRRLANCNEQPALNEIFLEWEDRFGKPPLEAQLLKESHRLRLLMEECKASELRVDKNDFVKISFQHDTPYAEILMQKIVTRQLLPAGENAVQKKLSSAEPLAQAQEIFQILHAVVSAGKNSPTEKSAEKNGRI